MESAPEVFTVGHSTMPYERFRSLLRIASITAVADVRSSPFSKFCAQFNRDTLRDSLSDDAISYVFLGDELGGRPKREELFSFGIANYEKMASTPDFERGLQRILKGAKTHRIAMMCSESDPLDCHRCLLVGRALHERGLMVRHILNESGGKIISHAEIERKLMDLEGKSDHDFFDSPEKRLSDAYRNRAVKVAFSKRSASRFENIMAE